MSVTSNQLLNQVKAEIAEVSAAQVQEDLKAGKAIHIVDVREREEVMDGYIPDAEMIPRGFLELNIEEDVTMDRDAEIVLYCAGGNRSALAARDLTFMGYTNVKSMIGGFKGWKDAGYSFDQGGLMSEDDMQRYARHIILPEVGEKGQQKLLKGRVLLVGVGGLGCPTALYLAAAGVGKIGLVDADVVDKSNLQRQVLFGESDVGRPKVEAARDKLLDLNSTLDVVTHYELLTSHNVFDVMDGYDIIVNGCDNFPTRYLVNDAAVMKNKPVVDGSIFRFEGQATVYVPGEGPCYRCLYPAPPPPGEVPSCAEGGVLGVLPGTVGLMQATEVVKMILGEGKSLVGRVLLYDAMEMKFRELKLRKDPECPVCNESPTITELIDYEQFCGLPSLGEAAG
ncbi:MAG: molybdopterin-synthase adenylyltransferase MoeB [Gemmatimonadetes bacterium]|jgi:sulfur-carrier protein adenylyltransferase/sulfurtransferase|nr:molybdopterin-synthase adenylyltransferase MoeB [Gemmatimonadota bacterium]MBT5330130.1 molybdopterin-synthase adenylyltransferase MoeB [Gemmatimonadota bacterium]MBT5450898.1 molybdopterin-synthase adenylyltransferase MoeB [Gemmatimonadota bacterium]MBT5802360.1 molybdopterin-synthase adenylyltransferase MoeB [Gemmatimonadota bacterium]MBT6619297.1 molybdopterin-synthase adenylyltransferase MoeB [Gemmatimonadota bacterium]